MAFDGASAPRAVDFLNVHFSGLDLGAALDVVTARASLDAPFVYVSAANVDHIVGLAEEPTRRSLYDGAWLTLNDSCVVRSLAARTALDLPVAAGADLAENLLDHVIDRHEPITIIGSDEDKVDELKRRYALTDVRWHKPPIRLKQQPRAIVEAAAFAAAQRTRFTFICVGAPQQELIAYAIAQRGDAIGIGLCVGSLDFLSGPVQAAPKWVRALGLEGLHHLLNEARRLWRRHFVDQPKLFSLFAEWRASMAAASAT